MARALLTSGRSSSRRKSEVLRPLESEKTFLLVQVKLSASRKWKLSRLCFVARASYRVCLSFPFLFLRFLLSLIFFFSPPPPPFFFSFYPSFGFITMSRIQQGLNAIFLLLYRTLPKRGSARTIR